MKILFIGDVVGENGQDLLAKALPELKAEHKPDITIVNGENSHKSGTGITENDARFLFGCGADVITGGNHSLRRCGIDFYEENDCGNGFPGLREKPRRQREYARHAARPRL